MSKLPLFADLFILTSSDLTVFASFGTSYTIESVLEEEIGTVLSPPV